MEHVGDILGDVFTQALYDLLKLLALCLLISIATIIAGILVFRRYKKKHGSLANLLTYYRNDFHNILKRIKESYDSCITWAKSLK